MCAVCGNVPGNAMVAALLWRIGVAWRGLMCMAYAASGIAHSVICNDNGGNQPSVTNRLCDPVAVCGQCGSSRRQYLLW